MPPLIRGSISSDSRVAAAQNPVTMTIGAGCHAM